MAGLPKLVVIVLVIFAVWYAVRAFNRMRPPMPPRRPQPQARPRIEAEDLVSCSACGTYIASSARHCGRAGCPQPR
jgi:hypothetical protein